MSGVLLKSFSFAVFCGVYAFNAAVGISLFSDYGQIQNVQNYSTNPFWSPGAPYNQRVPQPVYVQGTDLKSGECVQILEPLVSMECMARNNCKNTSLSDIRPSIMVQLSNLPNKNYVSACAGYIDSVFESYVAQYGNSVANGGYASFPNATTPANYSDNSTIQIQNPYKVQAPDWMVEINERKNELQQLQEQNGLGTEHLEATNFPSVYEDLSFTARMELQKEGYEPFKDKDSYIIPKFQNEGEWCNGDGKFTDFCKNREEKIKKTEPEKEEEKKPVVSSPLCPTNKKDLSKDKPFESCEVSNAGVAKKLVEELIKCSTEPELVVPSSGYYQTYCKGDDDCIFVYDGQTRKYHVIFDDIEEPYPHKYVPGAFRALCAIAGGEFKQTRHGSDTPKQFYECRNITQGQYTYMEQILKSFTPAQAFNEFRGKGLSFDSATNTVHLRQGP